MRDIATQRVSKIQKSDFHLLYTWWFSHQGVALFEDY